MRDLGKRLRERARQLNLSDAEVARRAGLNERRYGHYVTGMREPNLETLVRICAVLEITPNEVLGFGATEFSETREGTAEEREQAALRIRLLAASNTLDVDNLKLALKQIQVLLEHQREQSRKK